MNTAALHALMAMTLAVAACAGGASSTSVPDSSFVAAKDVATLVDALAAETGPETSPTDTTAADDDVGSPDATLADAAVCPPASQTPTLPCPADDEACIWSCAASECCKETTACLSDPSCAKLLACQQNCGPWPASVDKLCRADCELGVAPAASLSWLRVEFCRLSRCTQLWSPECDLPGRKPPGCFAGCYWAKCGEHELACANHPDCAAIYLCQKDCNGDPTCIYACGSKLSGTGKALWDASTACSLANCQG